VAPAEPPPVEEMPTEFLLALASTALDAIEALPAGSEEAALPEHMATIAFAELDRRGAHVPRALAARRRIARTGGPVTQPVKAYCASMLREPPQRLPAGRPGGHHDASVPEGFGRARP
jgi:hypothetical protein